MKMVDYERAKRNGPKLKAALTRANKKTDPKARYTAVMAACKAAVKEWEEWGAWPDGWSLWQRTLDDAFFAYARTVPYGAGMHRVERLEDL